MRPRPGRFSCLRRIARSRLRIKLSRVLNVNGVACSKIREPAPKHGVEVADDPIQTVAPSASRLGAHFVLERLQALLAHVSTPALEPIAQELESLARLSRVADACLVGVQRQAVGRRPRRHPAQRFLGFFRLRHKITKSSA